MCYDTTVVTVPFLKASLLGYLFSDMVRLVDCHAGVLGSNPGGPKRFSPQNNFIAGSGNSVAPVSASGSDNRLYTVVVDVGLSGNKTGKSVVTVTFLTASLLG